LKRSPLTNRQRHSRTLHDLGGIPVADVLGTLNFLDNAKRVEGARLVRRGISFSLALELNADGPQKGWRRRTNPVHAMLATGVDAEFGAQGFRHGFGGADDVIFMPLQASTQWDGLGHIFDHGTAYNGRRAARVVTAEGDQVTGIETVAGAVARAVGGERSTSVSQIVDIENVD
jgi:hypothetical protein